MKLKFAQRDRTFGNFIVLRPIDFKEDFVFTEITIFLDWERCLQKWRNENKIGKKVGVKWE